MNAPDQYKSYAHIANADFITNQQVVEANTGVPPIQEREALLLMQANDLDTLSVCRHRIRDGWIIKLKTKSTGNNLHVLATKREKTRRIFRTSDAALRWCKKIGFEEIEVFL